MKNFNQKIIVTGIALLLFGIILAIENQSAISYIFGGLGLFFAVIGCFAKENEK